MILARSVNVIRQYWALIYERQWANWELLTLAAAATVLFVLSVVGWRRRKRTDRRTEKGRSITPLPETTDHPCVRLLQRVIIKRDRTEARFAREISDLTDANRQLHREVAELTSANEQLQHEGRQAKASSERKVAELMVINDQLRREVAVGKKAFEYLKQEIAELMAGNGQRENDAAERKQAVGKETDDRHRKTAQPDNIQPSSDEPGTMVVPYAHPIGFFVDDWPPKRKSKFAAIVKDFAGRIFSRSRIEQL